MGLSNEVSCKAGSLSHYCNTHRFLQRFWGILFLCWNPGLLGLSHSPVVPSSLSTCKCGTSRSTQSTSCRLGACPLCSSCASQPLLLVWTNVSSLTPWLLDFHTVWFSGSSGCFQICCPSFSCARRQSISAYASIFARSPLYFSFNLKVANEDNLSSWQRWGLQV